MQNVFDIRAERTAKQLSQADIAAALGVNQSTVARWEDRPAQIKPFVIEAIKRAIEQAPTPRSAEAAE